LKIWGHLAFPLIPTKLAPPIAPFTTFEKGLFGKEEKALLQRNKTPL